MLYNEIGGNVWANNGYWCGLGTYCCWWGKWVGGSGWVTDVGCTTMLWLWFVCFPDVSITLYITDIMLPCYIPLSEYSTQTLDSLIISKMKRFDEEPILQIISSKSFLHMKTPQKSALLIPSDVIVVTRIVNLSMYLNLWPSLTLCLGWMMWAWILLRLVVFNFDMLWVIGSSNIDGIFLSLHRKNGLFCNREQPKLFIQRYSLNIMDVLRHKRFGCSAVYDKDLLRRSENGGFGAKNWQILDERGGFGGVERTNFRFFCQYSLNAAV